jgi:hypothetical protein
VIKEVAHAEIAEGAEKGEILFVRKTGFDLFSVNSSERSERA